jgi:hypothetical protein
MESEALRSALRQIKEDVLDAMRLIDPSHAGDHLPLDILENMYVRTHSLLKNLEAGNWAGRTVETELRSEPENRAFESFTSASLRVEHPRLNSDVFRRSDFDLDGEMKRRRFG